MITYADLKAMFPTHLRSAHQADVELGLPSLNAAMKGVGMTLRGQAAFLTTLAFESMFEYNIHQFNTTSTYTGRGYIQLTGIDNYRAAGTALGVDLVNHPELALSLLWSAKIAIWYITKARPMFLTYAERLEMGKCNAAIGYPRAADGSNDNARCAAFAGALKYLTGSVPAGITCTR